MAFWSKKDSDADEIRISKEEYEDLKKVEDKWFKLQAAIVADERLIILRSEYDQLEKDSTALSAMQERLTKALEQCQYWERQAKLAKSLADDAQTKAVTLEKKYNELYLNIDKHFADREKKLENDRLEAAKQDVADLKELKMQLQKEADAKIAKSIKDANQKLAKAAETDRNALLRLQRAQDMEKSNEAREKALKAREDAYTVREQNVAEREQAISGQLASAQNIYRIMRERANAARGITPKKQHDGYLVLGSRQWEEKYQNVVAGKRMQCSDIVWKSVLQSPYSAGIPIDQIRDLIEGNLRDSIAGDLGCDYMVESKQNGRYKSTKDKMGCERNGLYKWTFQANYRSQLWEVDIYTMKDIFVKESRRPPQQQKKSIKK